MSGGDAVGASRTRPIAVRDGVPPATGLEVDLPGGAQLVLAWGRAGFVMCGFLDLTAAEKRGVAAAIVRGVKTIDDLLAADVQEVTSAAATRGVVRGMSGRDALALLT
jgi:uncharacterized protein YunC (DUF1805 family)